jgi:hypothetical protein
MNDNPMKFHKSLGNVKDEDVSPGEIRLLQTLVRDSEDQIVMYRMKEIKIAEKIKELWSGIKEFKQLAQESRIFIDQHPLFSAICAASGITPEKGRKLFYKRVENKIARKIQKRKQNNGQETEDSCDE